MPGPVTSRLSAGTHALIQAGAPLIRDTTDALDLLAGATGRAFARVLAAPARPDLPPPLLHLLDAIEDGAGTLGELAKPPTTPAPPSPASANSNASASSAAASPAAGSAPRDHDRPTEPAARFPPRRALTAPRALCPAGPSPRRAARSSPCRALSRAARFLPCRALTAPRAFCRAGR